MAAAFNVRTSTGTVVSVLTAAHIEVSGADVNEADGTEKRYYIRASHDDYDHLRSHVFNVSHPDGKHTWDNLLFPLPGTWTLELHDVSDDSVVESDTVEVAPPA